MTKTDFTLEDLKREVRRVIEIGETQLGFDGQSALGPMPAEDRAQIERQVAGNRALLVALEELERRRAGDEPTGLICEEGHEPIKYYGDECPMCVEIRLDAITPTGS